MERKKRKSSIIIEVAVYFLVGIIMTGILTYITETRLYDKNVKKQTEFHAEEIAEEVKAVVREYPAYKWLVSYWYYNSDRMDIEYDAATDGNTLTAEKCRIFEEKYPQLQLRYLEEEQIGTLPEEDKKLYAEIAYSWLITRVNQIKRAYRVDYLFCVISKEPFDKQFFLFSGAEDGVVRGTSYEQVYPIGHVVTVGESQTDAMRSACLESNHLADAGNYVDYYSYMYSFDGHSALIGLTYDLSELRADIKNQTAIGTRLAIIHQVVLSVICLILILIFVLHPLKTVQFYIRDYKQTKNSKTVSEGLTSVRLNNEIGNLAEDVSTMVKEIDSYMEEIRTITAERERIGTELALATRIQAAMLPNVFPPFPDRSEFDIYASMDPAKEVGGDFYDFFLIDSDHLCLVIADVSGKGIPAALFMMASKIILANNAMSGKSPSQILADTNAAICSRNNEEMFVTVWLGILEISTGILTAANAGHEYPALRSPGGDFELLKDKHGLVIGGLEGSEYSEYTVTLTHGSKLFLYTDGVAEATDADDELFGTSRMITALNKDPDRSPEGILVAVRGAVDEFVGDMEQFDDLTMLCLEYK